MNFSKYSRSEGKKSQRKTVLLVCEGTQTEPNYFHSFNLAHVIEISGTGSNTNSLVEIAIREKKEKGYDEVWCVFDRDSFPSRNLSKAFDLMRQHGLRHAYSSEAFELWYLLHFCFLDVGITRVQYREKLTALLGKKYEKNALDIYGDLLGKQSTAIKHAKRLAAMYDGETGPIWKRKPYTSVHELVELLNKLKKKYNQ